MIWKSYKVGPRNGLLHSIPPKLKCFFISKSENGSDIILRFNNRRLEVSTVHMYLGIALSNDTK